jgi:hypothetical protein
MAGCATAPQIEYRYLKVPEPPVITRPELEVVKLQPGATAATVIQAHRQDILSLQKWGLELEGALNAYRAAPAASAP